MSLFGCIRNMFKSQDDERNESISFISSDNANMPDINQEKKQTCIEIEEKIEVSPVSLSVEMTNQTTSKNQTGFDMPEFLSHRCISKYDALELQKLFNQNEIECFKDLTVDMLRSFLKYSYADAIYVIELLGLYGVKFNTEKLKQFSNPHTSNYRMLKFDRTTSDITINENSVYETEKTKLKRYLFDMKLSSSFLLDGIKLDVLLAKLGFSEEILCDLLNLNFYSQTELQYIYFREENGEIQNEVFNEEIPSNNKQLLFDFSENNNYGSVDIDKPEDISEISIDDLWLSVRSYNALKTAGIKKLDELISLSKDDLYRIPKLGRKSVEELLAIQNKYPELMKRKEIEEKKYVQKIPSYIADTSLPHPEFSVRLSNVLKRNNIQTIKDVVNKTSKDLLHLENMGRKSYNELCLFLKSLNIEIDKDYEIVEDDKCILMQNEAYNIIEEKKDNLETLQLNLYNFESKYCDGGKKLSIYQGRIKDHNKKTLQEIGDKFSLSRERIRQIEKSMINKLKYIISHKKHVFDNLFEKYGNIIAYKKISEFSPIYDYENLIKKVLSSYSNSAFLVDTDIGIFYKSDVDIDNITIEEKNQKIYTITDIKDELSGKIVEYICPNDINKETNYNYLIDIFTKFVIDNYFVYDKNKDNYVVKNSSRDTDIIVNAFRELYPQGILLHQKIDEIHDDLSKKCKEIDIPTGHALASRLTGRSDDIILTNPGFYQHIENIKLPDKEVLDFALQECKYILLKNNTPFLISVVFEKHKDYFMQNGVFSEYLLFSLLKRLNDSSLMLRRLTVYNSQKENFSQLDYFEEYFKSQKGIISLKDVEEHFLSLGWNDLRLSNYLGISTNVFKISNGYFHKDNVICNMEKLNNIMDKVRIKIEECGYVSLEVIKNKNFVEWLGVFENEDLDAKSMASIIRAFYPDCPYEVSSNGLISYGSKLKPYEALYNWMTQKCKEDQFVTTAQISSFCDDNKFQKYNTRNQIKSKTAEIDEDCWVTYDYLGLNTDIENILIQKIGEIFINTMKPYMSIIEILFLVDLPVLNNNDWNEYIVRSIVENRGSLKLYNLVIVNPYQTEIITLDRIVANEIFNFTQTWYMETEKLERLLRRNKIFGKNETFSHKTIQNLVFHENSYIELRDQNKNACIKAEFREVFQ